MKYKTTFLFVALLVYLPAVILVGITDFAGKNLLIRTFLIGAFSGIFFSVIRYNYHKDMKLN